MAGKDPGAPTSPPSVGGDVGRFLIAGLINTGLTLLVFQLLLLFLSPELAYVGSWLAGLAFVAVFYPAKVFKGGRTAVADRILVAGSYAVVFACGLLLLSVLEQFMPPRIGIFFVIGATTVLNFVLSRLILRR